MMKNDENEEIQQCDNRLKALQEENLHLHQRLNKVEHHIEQMQRRRGGDYYHTDPLSRIDSLRDRKLLMEQGRWGSRYAPPVLDPYLHDPLINPLVAAPVAVAAAAGRRRMSIVNPGVMKPTLQSQAQNGNAKDESMQH